MSYVYTCIDQFVTRAFAAQQAILNHLRRTEYWARQFQPNADTTLYCAALAHDIERSEPDNDTNRPFRISSFRDPDALRYHQQRGAEILECYLRTKKIERSIIARICLLVAHHETGGSATQNFVKDVDSLSFLENNLDHFMEKLLPQYGLQEVTAKFAWMYERISDPTIRQFAKPFYLDALNKLKQASTDGIQ